MRIAVTSLGVKFLPERFASILRKSGYDATFYPPKKFLEIPFKSVNVLWLFGAFGNFDILLDYAKNKNPNIRNCLIWVGTDIINLHNLVRSRPKCRECMLLNVDIHVVDDLSFIRELKDGLGIDKAWFVPSVPEPMPLTPLPNEFAVALYIPCHRKEYYGFPQLVEVAKEFPDVPFHVFALSNVDRDRTTPPLPNIHFVGFVEGEQKLDWWRKNSAFISIPVHGGVSLMLIEYAMMGRRVVTNKKLPHVYHVKEPVKPDDIVTQLKKIMKFKDPDEEASRYFQEEYSYKKVIDAVKPIMEKLSDG